MTLYLLPPRLQGDKTAFEARPKTPFTAQMERQPLDHMLSCPDEADWASI